VVEVELKARIRDRAAAIDRISSFARPVGPVDKRDEYWRMPLRAGGGAADVFRLREESGSTVVTLKEKRRDGGVETNRELEFGISDRPAFAELMRRAGCEPYYVKSKRGESFAAPVDSALPCETATIEVFEVSGLGDFVEIEILVPEGDGEAADRAARELRILLSRAGVPESDIEPRFYSELLAEAGLAPRSGGNR
jgi:predicted adenylyl cyclase CyaB